MGKSQRRAPLPGWGDLLAPDKAAYPPSLAVENFFNLSYWKKQSMLRGNIIRGDTRRGIHLHLNARP